MDAEILLRSYREQVDRELDRLLPTENEEPRRLHEAMRYSCLAPGKRLRPALCMASCESAGADSNRVLSAAAGIEMIHVFSLIHDDLPAIDDDELRRGRPTCHRRYGEALAILAGDALFALGFQALAETEFEPGRLRAALDAMATAAGSNGLVGGEVIDVESEGRAVEAETLELIHRRKTGALLSASCEIGGLAGGADERACQALRSFGMEVGLAFQIIDDVLNETATAERLGKAAGSDRARKKATYPALHGIEASRGQAQAHVDQAMASLAEACLETKRLETLARYSVERGH